MQYRTTDIRTGLFIAFSIFAFTLVIFLMGGLRGAFRDARDLHAHFDDVLLLEVEAAVTVGGFRVGDVAGIQRIEDPSGESKHKIAVRMRIDRDLVLWSDARATVKQDGFLGPKFVALDLGSSGDRLSERAILVGSAERQMSDVIAKTEEPLAHLNRLLAHASSLLENEKLLAAIEGIVVDGHSVVQRVRDDALPKVESLLARANGTVDNLSKRLDSITAKFDRSLDATMTDARGLIGAVRERIDGSSGLLTGAEALVADLRMTTGELQALLREAKVATTETRVGVGNVLASADRLLVDNNRNVFLAMRNLRDVTVELERLIRKVRADPSVLIWGDDEPGAAIARPGGVGARRRAGRVERYGKEPTQ